MLTSINTLRFKEKDINRSDSRDIMKKIVCFLIFVFILSQVAAQSNDIFNAESLLLEVTMNSDFTLEGSSDSQIEFVTAKFNFYPIENYNQEVISIETYPESEFKKDYYEFKWNNPQLTKYSYNLKTKVKTYNKFLKVKEKVKFPITELDPDLEEYVQKTDKIDINEDIILQASTLAQGEDDLYQVVFNLATWTKQNINYSLTTFTSEASQKASWVLENKYGVCDELTNLFIAMCRSLNIPARFVSGISYTNSELFTEEWGLHGWAEVYFPDYGWVSFDPTYGQYGYVDAGHVKLRDSFDSDKTSTKFEWLGNNVDLNPGLIDNQVIVLDEGDKIHNYVDIELSQIGNEVDFGSYNLIEANLKNKMDYYVTFELALSKSQELELIDDRIKFVLLEPNKEKSVYWIVKVSDDLKKHYVYTFPIEAFSSLGYSDKSNFDSSERSVKYEYDQIMSLLNNMKEEEQKVYSKNIELKCSYPNLTYVNDTINVNCNVVNKGNVLLNNLNVCLVKDCEKINLGISQTKEIIFDKQFTQIGEQVLTVSTKNGEVSKYEQLKITVEGYPNFEILNITYPETLDFGPEFNVMFELEKVEFTNPENVNVVFAFNNMETSWQFDEIESRQGFTVNLDKSILDPKDNKFDITVEFYDKNNKKYVKTYEQSVPIKNVGLFDRIMMFFYGLERWIDGLF